MLKSIFVSSLVISQTFGGETFKYPEDETIDSWANEDNYCGKNHVFQSPIDIDTSKLSTTCPTTKSLTFSPNTAIKEFKVENTGHNLKIIPVISGVDDDDDSNDDDSNDNPEFENVASGAKFGTLTDIFGSMGTYCLDSFHLHWGQHNAEGSEHRIDSKQSVMEMHFVHRACKYNTVHDAISIPITDDAKADPTLAVVSVLFEIGDENLFIKEIVDQSQKLQKAEAEIVINSEDEDRNMFDVLPMNDGKIIGNYYHYKGSLTTPPCTPVVSWHVLEKKMTVSSSQLQALRENIQNEAAIVGTSNFRGTKTNGNTVSKCSASGSGDDSGDDSEDDNDEKDD